MKINFADVLFHKKHVSLDTLVGQTLGDISCETLVMAAVQTKDETTLTIPYTPWHVLELPPHADEEE